MSRSLMQQRISQLEDLFATSKSDKDVLQQLADELQHRKVPRAVALLAQVKAAVRAVSSNRATIAVTDRDSPQADDRERTPTASPRPEPVTSSVKFNGASVSEADSYRASPPGDVVPSMSVDDAYKILKATPSLAWEAIEQARRQLIEQANPGRTTNMTPEKRMKVQAEAKRANIAYRVLIAARQS